MKRFWHNEIQLDIEIREGNQLPLGIGVQYFKCYGISIDNNTRKIQIDQDITRALIINILETNCSKIRENMSSYLPYNRVFILMNVKKSVNEWSCLPRSCLIKNYVSQVACVSIQDVKYSEIPRFSSKRNMFISQFDVTVSTSS